MTEPSRAEVDEVSLKYLIDPPPPPPIRMRPILIVVLVRLSSIEEFRVAIFSKTSI